MFLYFLNKDIFYVELRYGIHSGGGIQLFIKIQLNALTAYVPLIISHLSYLRHVGWSTVLQAGRSRLEFPAVSLEFFIDIIPSAALWPWGRLNL